MSRECFNFSWSEYQIQSKSLLDNIYKDSEFHDVTLVTDDEKIINTHKVVLAAGSDYFRKILTVQNHPHPLLLLRGVSGTIFDSILKFLYLGETSVRQEDIQEFVQVSKYLKIRDIDPESCEHEYRQEAAAKAGNAKDNSTNISDTETIPDTATSIVDVVDEAAKRFSVDQVTSHNEDSNESLAVSEDGERSDENVDSFQQLLMEKQQEHIEINLEDDEDEETNNANDKIGQNDYVIGVDDDVEEDIEVVTETVSMELETIEEESSKDPEPENIYCDRCDFETTVHEDYYSHISAVHVNDIPCKDCDFMARDKASLKTHMVNTHKGISCNHCHMKFSDLTHLRKHILANEACMANLF